MVSRNIGIWSEIMRFWSWGFDDFWWLLIKNFPLRHGSVMGCWSWTVPYELFVVGLSSKMYCHAPLEDIQYARLGHGLDACMCFLTRVVVTMRPKKLSLKQPLNTTLSSVPSSKHKSTRASKCSRPDTGSNPKFPRNRADLELVISLLCSRSIVPRGATLTNPCYFLGGRIWYNATLSFLTRSIFRAGPP